MRIQRATGLNTYVPVAPRNVVPSLRDGNASRSAASTWAAVPPCRPVEPAQRIKAEGTSRPLPFVAAGTLAENWRDWPTCSYWHTVHSDREFGVEPRKEPVNAKASIRFSRNA